MLRIVLFSLLWHSLFSCSSQYSHLDPTQRKTLQATRYQIGKTTSYDPSYVSLNYPNGDVPIHTGVCTDVIIRTLRRGHNIDLQKCLHLDMLEHFDCYPQQWGLLSPDPNIDHRRVPNLQTYFTRMGWELELTKVKQQYRPGDILTCAINGVTPHIMIVSDRKGSSGHWALIHNIGIGVIENDVLFRSSITGPLTGHYRIPQ